METIELRRRVSSAHRKQGTEIIYELVYDNGHYGIECYTPNHMDRNYCYYHSISDDLQSVQRLFRLLYQKGVRPLHLADVIEDYYAC